MIHGSGETNVINVSYLTLPLSLDVACYSKLVKNDSFLQVAASKALFTRLVFDHPEDSSIRQYLVSSSNGQANKSNNSGNAHSRTTSTSVLSSVGWS